MMRAPFTVCLALMAVAGVAACTGADTSAPSPRAEALAYMQAHPAPARAEMTAGVVLAVDDAGFAGAAAREARCPATLAASVAGAVGNLPGCGAWAATAETSSGQVTHLSCGSIAARQACPLMLRANGYLPFPGDYVRFRPDGLITGLGDIQVITEFAVAGIPAPDSGGPAWITSPAGGSS